MDRGDNPVEGKTMADYCKLDEPVQPEPEAPEDLDFGEDEDD